MGNGRWHCRFCFVFAGVWGSDDMAFFTIILEKSSLKRQFQTLNSIRCQTFADYELLAPESMRRRAALRSLKAKVRFGDVAPAGEWILCPHDGMLEPGALENAARLLRADPDVD